MDLDFDALDEQEEETRIDLARQAGFAPEGDVLKIKRLWCISDVHTDHAENLAWLENVDADEFKKDVLILAGDVSHDMDVLRKTLSTCQSKFADVLFTPGNHDLWVTNDPAYRKGECPYKDSFAKLRHILHMCDEMGIGIRPQLYEIGDEALWIAPLLSYHHISFDTEPNLQEYWGGIEPLNKVVSDFHTTVWPDHLEMGSDAVAESLDALNEDVLDGLPAENLEAYMAVLHATPEVRAEAETRLVTFSHFVPRIELMPEKRFMTYPDLAKASGSKILQRRINAMKPDVHVFGHTHFGWDIEIEGTRFVQAPLAMPKDRLSRPSLFIGEFAKPPESQPLLLREEDEWAEHYPAAFSDYYLNHARQPGELRNIQHFLRQRYQWIGPGDPPPDSETPFEQGGHFVNFAPKWVLRGIRENNPEFAKSLGF